MSFFRKKILKNRIRILVITDTHGIVPEQLTMLSPNAYDICFLLGDIYQTDIKKLKTFLDLSKTYGIVGNHNSECFMKRNGITDIHGKVVEKNGITFAGWGGSLKYRASIELGFDGYGGIDSLAFAKSLPAADVLISHDGPMMDNNCSPHSGIRGIREYIFQKHPALHIHGHWHRNKEEKIGRTKSICVFRAAIIDEYGRVSIIC